jgi:hypothetical protein
MNFSNEPILSLLDIQLVGKLAKALNARHPLERIREPLPVSSLETEEKIAILNLCSLAWGMNDADLHNICARRSINAVIAKLGGFHTVRIDNRVMILLEELKSNFYKALQVQQDQQSFCQT